MFYKGHLIKKRLGQVFLTKNIFIEKIISKFNPEKNQNIVEIGPGLGSLTYPIIKFVKKMTVIEIDCNLANRLIENTKYNKKLDVITMNVININFFDFFKKNKQLIRIIGNLPYNSSIPIIFHLFKYAKYIQDMYLMFQKEVADRLLAQPNNKKYGALSVMTQYICKIKHIINVPSSAFTPNPKVQSSMLSFSPYRVKPYPVFDIKLLNFILRKAFSQKRKKIKNSLFEFFSLSDFLDLKIDPNSRAENISVNDFCNLTCKFFKIKHKL